MLAYVAECQRQLLTTYGFPAKPGHPTLPDDGVPDGIYPMIIDGRLDFTRIVDGAFVLAQPASPADIEEARGYVADRFDEMRKAGNDTAAHKLNLVWMRLADVPEKTYDPDVLARLSAALDAPRVIVPERQPHPLLIAMADAIRAAEGHGDVPTGIASPAMTAARAQAAWRAAGCPTWEVSDA